jgi:hypothetical protein
MGKSGKRKGVREMKFAAVFAAAITLTLITSCGSSGGGSTSIVPPVQAQSGYSDASITGTYSFILNQSGDYSALGTFSANGSGTITSGTVTITNAGTPAPSCSGTLTGNYSLLSSATGTASLTFTITSGASNCTGLFPASWLTFNIEAGSSGASLLLASSFNGNLQGSAIKQ